MLCTRTVFNHYLSTLRKGLKLVTVYIWIMHRGVTIHKCVLNQQHITGFLWCLYPTDLQTIAIIIFRVLGCHPGWAYHHQQTP